MVVGFSDGCSPQTSESLRLDVNRWAGKVPLPKKQCGFFSRPTPQSPHKSTQEISRSSSNRVRVCARVMALHIDAYSNVLVLSRSAGSPPLPFPASTFHQLKQPRSMVSGGRDAGMLWGLCLALSLCLSLSLLLLYTAKLRDAVCTYGGTSTQYPSFAMLANRA